MGDTSRSARGERGFSSGSRGERSRPCAASRVLRPRAHGNWAWTCKTTLGASFTPIALIQHPRGASTCGALPQRKRVERSGECVAFRVCVCVGVCAPGHSHFEFARAHVRLRKGRLQAVVPYMSSFVHMQCKGACVRSHRAPHTCHVRAHAHTRSAMRHATISGSQRRSRAFSPCSPPSNRRMPRAARSGAALPPHLVTPSSRTRAVTAHARSIRVWGSMCATRRAAWMRAPTRTRPAMIAAARVLAATQGQSAWWVRTAHPGYAGIRLQAAPYAARRPHALTV